MRNNNIFLGYTFAVISSVCYGLNPLFALPLYDMGVNPLNVLFYRYGISTVLMALLMMITKEPFRMTRKELFLSALMGMMFAASSVCLFFSFKFMNAGLASVILFTYPMFVALLSLLLFHEKLSKVTFLCIIIAFLGICLLDQKGETMKMNLFGMILAVSSGFIYALYLVGVNRSVLKTMSTIRLSFYALLSGTLFLFIAGRFGLDISPLPNDKAWLYAVGLAFFPTIISIVFVTKAIHFIGSVHASIMGALEPITALIVSLAFFGGTLTIVNIVGVTIVLFAVILMVCSNK